MYSVAYSVGPSLAPAVKSALQRGDIEYFKSIKDQAERAKIAIQCHTTPLTRSNCILTYAGLYKQFELCKFLLTDLDWQVPTQKLLFKTPFFSMEKEMKLKNISFTLFEWMLAKDVKNMDEKDTVFINYLLTIFRKAPPIKLKALETKLGMCNVLPTVLNSIIMEYLEADSSYRP